MGRRPSRSIRLWRVEPPQVVHGPVVVEPKPHPRDPIPHVADGVAAGLAWEIWQRGPGVRRRVVAVGGVGESVGGLACDEVAGAVHREPEGVVREVPVGQFRHRRPGLCVHGCGAQEHSEHAGPRAERVENHGAKVHWVNPRMAGEVHKVLDAKKPTRCAGFSLVRRDRDSNSGTKNIGHSLAGCCITTLPPLQRRPLRGRNGDANLVKSFHCDRGKLKEFVSWFTDAVWHT